MAQKHARTLLTITAAAFTLGLVAFAGAVTKTIQDKKGDAGAGTTDIRSVTARPTTHTITFRITAYSRFKTSRAPCVGMGATATKHPQGDHYEICGDGTIEDFQHGTKAGHAKVKRPNKRTIVYVLPRRLAPSQHKMSWAIQVRYGNCLQKGCDQAPQGPGEHVVQRI
jgi:hypothetical protein